MWLIICYLLPVFDRLTLPWLAEWFTFKRYPLRHNGNQGLQNSCPSETVVAWTILKIFKKLKSFSMKFFDFLSLEAENLFNFVNRYEEKYFVRKMVSKKERVRFYYFSKKTYSLARTMLVRVTQVKDFCLKMLNALHNVLFHS